ncbi:MAG: flagellar biosynthesis protein FlhA [Spirochaetales bacterium]|jgi:flagellar biosynthesis protein FlhA|nr:flagellar biosynthesis protein FlhA [Spirochaetales bacterium]
MADISNVKPAGGGFSALGKIFSPTATAQRNDIWVAVGVIVVVAMLIVPLPTLLLDVLMVFNLTLSLLIILITLYTVRALEFSVFPSILLVSTIFGLGLNVSSTRLILAQGEKFNGKIVRAFASFVVGTSGNDGLVIGFIIFIIIIAVQFMVITKGATRVSEVAARFTLDSLPGKQMAIDAEFSSGAILESEATRRKRDLQREADFYGSMDGASKFISGNVKVGLLITAVNIIGGLVVGVGFHGEDWSGAIRNYISFTVGDGLVSQFPALLISTATGLIVTRAVSEGSFGADVAREFTSQHIIFWIAGFFLFLMAFLPGFPAYVLIPMALLSIMIAVTLSRKPAHAAGGEAAKARGKTPEQAAEIPPVVPLDPLSLELGYGLVPLVDADQGAELLNRIAHVRRATALDMGLVVPKIRILDNMLLEPPEYCFKIKGVEVVRSSLRLGMYLAILPPGGPREEVPGEKTKEPIFGTPALWITEDMREKADRAGYTVVDPSSIIATHLTEVIKKHAAEILGRQELHAILETLKKDYPVLVEDALKTPLGLGGIQKVLQNLLRERVSIRNIVEILETIADYGGLENVGVNFMTEKVRQALARQICFQYADESKKLSIFTIMPRLQQAIIDSRGALKPEIQRRWILALRGARKHALDDAERFIGFIIVCSETARALVKASAARDFPELVVLSWQEISPDITTVSLGEITLPEK